MAVILVGTLDTKGLELGYVRDLLQTRGFSTIIIDGGTRGEPMIHPDITREELFAAAGRSWTETEAMDDRGEAITRAALGAEALAKRMILEQRVEIQGVLGIGGSAGTTIASAFCRALPFGIPKMLVSTMASGITRPYVQGADIVMYASVADLVGLNRLTRTVLGNAARGLAGMMSGPDAITSRKPPTRTQEENRPIVAATMFGVTTPCVDQARRHLERHGCEVLIFHATGVGGQAMETLIQSHQVDAVLDLTTTELADELVGGVLSAGPDRLKVAARAGIPQVVGLGALDMVNFGPLATVPPQFQSRKLHVHNPTVTLMRTTPEENHIMGERISEILCKAQGPTVVMISRGGLSALDAPGQPFYDPLANKALFDALLNGLADAPEWVKVDDNANHINDPEFSAKAAGALLPFLSGRGIFYP